MPTFPRGVDGFADTSGVARGAYTLLDVEGGAPDVVLIGTGSELQLAVAAREQLATDGIRARVVSMPCREWFEEQDQAYRDQVIPPGVKARVSVEARVSQGGARSSVTAAGSSPSSTSVRRRTTSGCSPSSGSPQKAVAQAAKDSIAAADAAH